MHLIHTALAQLRQDLPAMATQLHLDLDDTLKQWTQALDRKLLPKTQPDFPLVVAICGGGSAGKSTLFNALVGQPVSPTGGRAGLNRRVLVAVQQQHIANPLLMQYLASIFGGDLQPMSDAQQLVNPGQPVYCKLPQESANVVLLDTPDIDTGARGDYANRELARHSLDSADAFIYTFTNATYNNRDNTDFISNLLTGLGIRPCYLVYRVYPSFSDDEVREHALTVAVNLYGADYRQHILGIFRADDDNRVAAGQMAPVLRCIGNDGKTLQAALASLDPKALRHHVVDSMIEDAVGQAVCIQAAVQQAHGQLADYRNALEAAQGRCVQQALAHFPTDRVLRRFADIWLAGDPTHIKVMRGTGRVVEWPMRMVLAAVKMARSASAAATNDENDPETKLSMDLLQAANTLYQHTMDSALQHGDDIITAPPVVQETQAQLRQKDWPAVLTHIQQQKELILSWSEGLEADLKALAITLRDKMGILDQIRQTFAAMLNVIPATAAVTYILHTGDPAGAVGIKVKLTGLLGLNDLYALIAIPATAGLKKADQRQLEQMLAPVAQTWLTHKLRAVRALFETQITGDVLATVKDAYDRTEHRLARVASDLAVLEESTR